MRTQETNDAVSHVSTTHTGQPTANRTNANLLKDRMRKRPKGSAAAQQKEGSGWVTVWKATSVDLTCLATKLARQHVLTQACCFIV